VGFVSNWEKIENHLLKHPIIKEALATSRHSEEGDPYLCAYFVPSGAGTPGKTPDAATLREYLAFELPDHMIPAYFVPGGKKFP